jgi:hypothetical protein
MEEARKMSTKISSTAGRKWLATLWLLSGGVLFIIFIIQTISGKYHPKDQDAWGWLLPTIMPTLSLIVGVLVTNPGSTRAKVGLVDQYIFWLACGLSMVYLAAVAFTVLAQPFVSQDPLYLFQLSNLWLGPLQGLVAGALGVFFVKAEQSKK